MTRSGFLLCLSPFPSLKFLISPFDALRPRGGPYFLLLQKVGKDRRKGVSPPLRIPGPKWGAGRPPLEPPLPPRLQTRNVCLSCAKAHGTTFETTLRAKPFANLRGSSSRAAARSSAKPRFYSLFWRANCVRSTRQRDRRGGLQRGNAFGLLFCLLFCRSRKVGAPRGPSASKG